MLILWDLLKKNPKQTNPNLYSRFETKTKKQTTEAEKVQPCTNARGGYVTLEVTQANQSLQEKLEPFQVLQLPSYKGYKSFMNSNVSIYTCMTILSQSNLNESRDETQTVFHC